MHKRKKIMIDLDVVTVGIWEKSDPRRDTAREFMERAESKEFGIVTLSTTLNLTQEWKDKALSGEIRRFYAENTDRFIDDMELFDALKSRGIEINELLDSFDKHGIKEEDVLLVLTCSTQGLDCLVTFNKKHLRNKTEEINKTLREFKLPEIRILFPQEVKPPESTEGLTKNG